MRARGKTLISGLTTTALVAGAWLAVPTSAFAGVSSGAPVVINEVYGGGGNSDVPSDVTGTIAMSGTAGKVALVNSTSALTCGADCDGNAAVVDFVGFGTTANDFAGTGPTPAPSNTNSVSRNSSHDNTANNAADFTAGAPSPVACATACTTVTPPEPTEKTIAEIQGPGAASPLVGSTV